MLSFSSSPSGSTSSSLLYALLTLIYSTFISL